jgi:hypothetical protein
MTYIRQLPTMDFDLMDAISCKELKDSLDNTHPYRYT